MSWQDERSEDSAEPEEPEEIQSPTRGRRISDNILGIMSRLNLSSRSGGNEQSERPLCPLELDAYCNNSSETALHSAVRARHRDIVSALLAAGTNPNLLTQRGTADQVSVGVNFVVIIQN